MDKRLFAAVAAIRLLAWQPEAFRGASGATNVPTSFPQRPRLSVSAPECRSRRVTRAARSACARGQSTRSSARYSSSRRRARFCITRAPKPLAGQRGSAAVAARDRDMARARRAAYTKWFLSHSVFVFVIVSLWPRFPDHETAPQAISECSSNINRSLKLEQKHKKKHLNNSTNIN